MARYFSSERRLGLPKRAENRPVGPTSADKERHKIAKKGVSDAPTA